MDFNIDEVRKELDKDIERDLNVMYNLKRSESSSLQHFVEKKDEKESLVFLGRNRFELFEKIKRNWNKTHQRIKDFHQKKIQRFQQQFRLKYMFVFDATDYSYHKRIQALSKYTV